MVVLDVTVDEALLAEALRAAVVRTLEVVVVRLHLELLAGHCAGANTPTNQLLSHDPSNQSAAATRFQGSYTSDIMEF